MRDWVIIILCLVFVIVTFAFIIRAQSNCEAEGGHYLRTAFGYECIKGKSP